MKSKYIKYEVLSLMPFLLPAVMLILSGCAEERLIMSGEIEEGKDASVVLAWDFDAVESRSRAASEAFIKGVVNDIWIGAYDYTTGKLVSSKLYENVSGTYEESLGKSGKVTFSLSSGHRRIVAVANPVTNFGVSDNAELNAALGKGTAPSLSRLSELLRYADTWDKYKSISASLTRASDVTPIGADMVMSGVYYGSGSHVSSMSWTDANDSYVDIQPGVNTLDGKIHLRRMLSYIRFNIIAGEGITVEPDSWQVMNVPGLSYIHEQSGNSSDECTYFAAGASTPPGCNYSNSNRSFIFGGGKLEYADGSKSLDQSGYWFDFYQFENKRTGIYGSIYTDREREYKDGDGSNTGIYESLCPSVTDTYNNWGTYVVLRLRLSYSFKNDGGAEVNRVAYANYTIHLGYCEGADEAAKTRDFNCRRNTCYTYNVTVNGADKIHVEATGGDEEQPGAEGDVYDTSTDLISLDSHYCVYNVRFSNRERKGLNYTTVTYFDNQVYSFTQDDAEKFGENDYFNRQMVEWVQIMPTVDEKTVAPYPGEDKAWTLEDFRSVENGKIKNLHTDDKDGNADDDTERWYTVFFNEYAYKYDTDNRLMTNTETGGEGGWEKWVNQNDRQLILAIKNGNTSQDKESTYSQSKYGFLQHSIQTYYSTTKLTATGTAVGMEHENECFGLNFRWTWGNSMTLNQVNGRWNVWQFANGKRWDELISNEFATNPRVTEQFNYSTPNYYPAQTHPIRSLYGKSLTSHLETDPDAAYVYYEMMDVCMNRNRDLDGDGKISENEMRWYLPSTGKYLRLVLGRNSMKEPLMDYSSTTQLPHTTKWPENAKNTRFHFFTSDGAVLWAEEGLSKGVLIRGVDPSGDGSDHKYSPWEARCIRNLGVDHSKVLTDDPVTPAYITEYETDANGNRTAKYIDMSYYDDASKRAPIAGKILPHKVSEPANMVAPKLEFAERAIWVVMGSPAQEKTYADLWADSLINNSPCDRYSQDGDDVGWRVPNQKELAIMRQAGLITGGRYLSCSRTYFDDRFVGVIGDQSQAIDNGATYMGSFNVWCVRDVIENASRSRGKAPSRNISRAKATDFSYVTRDGKTASLYSLPKRPTLLIFYDPDCDHCRDAVATLRNDVVLSALVRASRVNVIAVDAEDDFSYWQRTARHLPEEWTVAFDRSGIIDNDIYPLEEVPMIYVLNEDRDIVVSKALPKDAVKTINRIVNSK